MIEINIANFVSPIELQYNNSVYIIIPFAAGLDNVS